MRLTDPPLNGNVRAAAFDTKSRGLPDLERIKGRGAEL